MAPCAFCRCIYTLTGHGDWQGSFWDAATDALFAFGGISAGLFSEAASFSKQACSTQLLGERCLALGILEAEKALMGWALLREANESSPYASHLLSPHTSQSPLLYLVSPRQERNCSVPSEKNVQFLTRSWGLKKCPGWQSRRRWLGSGHPVSNLVPWLCLASVWASCP